MHVSSRKLAQVVADRLNRIMPAPFVARTREWKLQLLRGEQSVTTISAAAIVEDTDDRTVEARVESSLHAMLDAVQDCLSEQLHEPWPDIGGRVMALPIVTVRDGRVDAAFGDESASRRLVLAPPIHLTDLIES